MILWIWLAFILAILALLALDLGVFHRKDKVIGVREALVWTGFWIALALLFNLLVYFMYQHHWLGIGQETIPPMDGRPAALKFLTGYLIEKSLSLDNIAVIAIIFTQFQVPAKYQHRVLFWGILGAIIMRALMIAAGIALIRSLDWIVYLFGAFLLFTAYRMLRGGQQKVDLKNSRTLRLARRWFPVTDQIENHDFFTRLNARRAVTPLFLVLLLVESSDVVFAVDSIPAILAVTVDPFLVFTSNIFAILGLRSLYFALASLLDRFRYLKLGLTVVLAYVGVKMLVSHHLQIPVWVSLVVILLSLVASILASLSIDRTGRS